MLMAGDRQKQGFPTATAHRNKHAGAAARSRSSSNGRRCTVRSPRRSATVASPAVAPRGPHGTHLKHPTFTDERDLSPRSPRLPRSSTGLTHTDHKALPQGAKASRPSLNTAETGRRKPFVATRREVHHATTCSDRCGHRARRADVNGRDDRSSWRDATGRCLGCRAVPVLRHTSGVDERQRRWGC